MILLLYTYVIWIAPSHPGYIGYKSKIDCEQSRLIDRLQYPVSKCFKKAKRYE